MANQITVGERLPNVRLRRLEDGRLEDYFLHDLTAGKKLLLVGFPGAYTPNCDGRHLPSFVANADHIQTQGVDQIVGIAVNDPWVMQRWEAETQAKGKVLLLSDGNADLTRQLGLLFDGQELGMGQRCQRFFLIADNGIVRKINVDRGMAYACTRSEDVLQVLI